MPWTNNPTTNCWVGPKIQEGAFDTLSPYPETTRNFPPIPSVCLAFSARVFGTNYPPRQPGLPGAVNTDCYDEDDGSEVCGYLNYL